MFQNYYWLVFVLLAVLVFGIVNCSQQPAKTEITEAAFGNMPDGTPINLYTLHNGNDVAVGIINYGGIVVSINVPDKDGKFEDVCLGFENLDGYLGNHPFFGALIGRYGNRIAKGQFTIDSVQYNLAVNNGVNSLHGGKKGFDKVIWDAKVVDSSEGQALELHYLSKDGEEGYPGNLDVTVTYALTNTNELRIDYLATTDKKTTVNLTNHAYFNLGCAGDILEHLVMINADKFTPVDSGLIPTGELRPVDSSPFDFRQPIAIGARINADDQQIKYGLGYDHNFVLNKTASEMSLAAKVIEPNTGRTMEVFTIEPGIQFYTGNFLDGTLTGKGGTVYAHRTGFCLETQHYPDSPNQPGFPPTILEPGQKYQTTTIYKFSVQR